MLMVLIWFISSKKQICPCRPTLSGLIIPPNAWLSFTKPRLSIAGKAGVSSLTLILLLLKIMLFYNQDSLIGWALMTGQRSWDFSCWRLLPIDQKCRCTSSLICHKTLHFWKYFSSTFFTTLKSSLSIPSQGSSTARATPIQPLKKMNLRKRKMGKTVCWTLPGFKFEKEEEM